MKKNIFKLFPLKSSLKTVLGDEVNNKNLVIEKMFMSINVPPVSIGVEVQKGPKTNSDLFNICAEKRQFHNLKVPYLSG